MKQLEIWYDGEESSKVTIEIDEKEYCFVKYEFKKIEQSDGFIYCTTSDVNKFVKWLKEDKWSDDEILELLSSKVHPNHCVALSKKAKEITKCEIEEVLKKMITNSIVERSNN